MSNSTLETWSYAYPQKALIRWSKENLTLEDLGSEGFLARFCYTGSTCSNMGMPLSFVFEVRLSSTEEGLRILEMECEPDPGDNGYQNMCSYLWSKEQMLHKIRTYHPLRGQPLGDSLSWNPMVILSGCFCTIKDVNHKWRIALQTIHFGIKCKDHAP